MVLLAVYHPEFDLTSKCKLTAIPVDTVRAIYSANMIESAVYRPSQSTFLLHLLSQVPEESHALVIALSEDISVARQDAFTSLPENQQRTIVDIAYQYLRNQQTNKARAPEIAKRSHQLLLLLNSYSMDTAERKPVEIPAAPEKGHGSKRITVGMGKRLGNNYAELGLKMSLHDLEDNEEGFFRGAQINIINLQVRAEENAGFSLYKLD